MVRRLISCSALASIAILAIGGPAAAHIDPEPTEAPAGSRLTVGFTVEHGCEGSPTTQLDMRLPTGVGDPVPERADGWAGSVDDVDGDTIVTFVGGSLADDVEGTFSVTMTLPTTPDTTVYFPFVQRCEIGEIRWIGIPAEPGDVLDEPAPAMTLTGPVATVPPEVTVVESTAVTTPESTAVVSTAAPAATTTDAPTDTTAAPATSTPVVIAQSAGDSGNSGTGTIVFIVSVACVIGLGAFVAYRARQARAANPD